MSESYEVFVLPLLTAVGVFALVGLIWNLTEGYFEERRKDQR
ncbi:MAG TPA: hypothetical protein VFC53_05040 [Dehalococcoidia bacterium]|jgi:hypothetical protein|nr:hypothetical protein [Dehalococcoidia bacterium]